VAFLFFQTGHKMNIFDKYKRLKKEDPSQTLLFKVGDFYQLFYDDATKVSALLGLTLIVRTKGREELVPMAGFPYQHLDGYLAKMVQQGLTVSVVEGI